MKAKTKKIGKLNFEQISCSKKYSVASKAAIEIRKKGNKARVLKNGLSYCVFKGSALIRK